MKKVAWNRRVKKEILIAKKEKEWLEIIENDNSVTCKFHERESRYSGTQIALTFRFTKSHPFDPPLLHVSPIIFHPNIDEYGEIKWFARNWCPAYTILRIIKQFKYLLQFPGKQNPEIFKDLIEDDEKDKGKEEQNICFDEVFENPYAWEIWSNL